MLDKKVDVSGFKVSPLWGGITARDLGIPMVPTSSLWADAKKVLKWKGNPNGDKLIPFITRLNTEIPNARYVVRWDDFRAYNLNGGDPSRAIISFMSNDAGDITPLWKPDIFAKRLDAIVNGGYKLMFAPDFSVYTSMPTALQIWNLFRSLTVSLDFAKAGITLIPNANQGLNSPRLVSVGLTLWPTNAPVTVLNLNNMGGKMGNVQKKLTGISAIGDLAWFHQLMWDSLRKWRKRNPDTLAIVYTRSKQVLREWDVKCPGPYLHCNTRASAFDNHIKAYKKQFTSAELRKE